MNNGSTRTLLTLSLGVLGFIGVSGGIARADDCERAWAHLVDLPIVKENSDSRASFLSRCRAGAPAASCVLAADGMLKYLSCTSGSSSQAWRSPKPDRSSKPGPSAATRRTFDAIGAAPRGRRLAVVAQGLVELDGWRYGLDLVPILREMPSADALQRRQMLLRGLRPRIVESGCAGAVGKAMAVSIAAQAEVIRKGCPSGEPVFPASRVSGAPAELALLAIVFEVRARRDGFADEPLHRAVVDAVLGER